MAEQPATTFGNVWIQRAKFVLGVLAVWAGVSVIKFVASETVLREDPFRSYLEPKRFCAVREYGRKGRAWSPVECRVFDLDYQRDRSGKDGSRDVSVAAVEVDTLIMVESDEEWFMPRESDGKHIDPRQRMIRVYFLNGEHSGRLGMIERHKIQPIP